jgi:hypothetical protein
MPEHDSLHLSPFRRFSRVGRYVEHADNWPLIGRRRFRGHFIAPRASTRATIVHSSAVYRAGPRQESVLYLDQPLW